VSRYFQQYKPYVPVGQRRVDGNKAVEKLRKKGMAIEPLGELAHRTKIASSFWGNAWCKHLESFSDFENRLPRGRTYVRNGSVLHLAIEPGSVKALVQGSSLYEETVTIEPLDAAKWQSIQGKCRGHIGSLIELLQGKISDEIMRVVTDPDHGLFPKPSEIKLDCSCPDWATMCKHVAAVLYGVGARLDSRPELLFKLRGVDHNDLITAAAEGPGLDPSTGGLSRRRRTIASGNLNSVFGVDFEAPVATPAKKAAKPAAKKALPAAPKKTPVFKPTSAAVRRLRKTLGATPAQFAAILGVSTQSVTNWEAKRGELKLQASNLAKLQALARDSGKK
jgi:uncharacterized Zn finger protein